MSNYKMNVKEVKSDVKCLYCYRESKKEEVGKDKQNNVQCPHCGMTGFLKEVN